jgi:uncharacterized membrane protein
MAAQKKPVRPRQGATRSGGNVTRQHSATATAKATGNGAASARARQAAGAAGKPRSATAARPAGPRPAAKASSPRPSGPVGRLLAPFSSVGPLAMATFVLSIYALGASIYLTIAHYDTGVTLVCSDKGLVNCAEVTTSPQSMVFGIFPVAVLGLAYYVFMTGLNSPWVWRLQQTGSEQLSKILRYTRLGAVVAGMGFVLYLVYAELIQIRAICLWCTSVHVATFLIFALVVFHTTFSAGPTAPTNRG